MSWVVIRLEDGSPVAEIHTKRMVELIDKKRFKVVPISEHLSSLNEMGKKP